MLEKFIQSKFFQSFLFMLNKFVYTFKHGKDQQRKLAFTQFEEQGIKNVPIFIISFNRLSYVKHMVNQLEKYGYNNINIIDNHSSYPPLLDYLHNSKHKVFFLDNNEGYLVFWKNPIFEKYRENFYVVTDPDLDIIDECPDDFMLQFYNLLKKYPFLRKTGFSLKIDDIPCDALLYNDVSKWEQQFYRVYSKKDKAYYAGIDTTFALYLPDKLVYREKYGVAMRTAYPYVVRHLPWYKKENDVTDEDKFYSSLKTNGWSDPVKGFIRDSDQQINGN